MKSFIAGKGQIGRAVYSVVARTDTVVAYDINDGQPPEVSSVDIVHICYPYGDIEGLTYFVDSVKYYITKYKPEHVIIWSTVPIGTTKKIPGAVHSPVEGVHPVLDKSIRSMTRWIGANNAGEGEFFVNYFKQLLIPTKLVESSDYTEALKLLSTTEYGVNIEFARYKKRVADDIDMPYELTKQWNQAYNKLYHNLDIPWAKKYVLDAPFGKKGGHCVIPNAVLLYKQFPDELVKIVGEL